VLIDELLGNFGLVPVRAIKPITWLDLDDCDDSDDWMRDFDFDPDPCGDGDAA
jgi:hypothetical protein